MKQVEPKDHRFIVLAQHCMSRQEAEERVIDACRRYGATESKSQISKKGILFTTAGGETKQLNFARLVEETRRTGIVPELDRGLWLQKTPHSTMAFAATAEGMNFTLTTGVRSSCEARMPGYLTNDVVSDILEDVLSYREEAARLSMIVEDSYKKCFRAYRAYLGSCITVIDATLNKRAWFAVNDPVHTWTQDERNVLGNQFMSLNKKLDKWLPILTKGKSLSKTSSAWVDYDKIRQTRNSYVHVNEPDYVFSLREAADGLNLCQAGVGQLLTEILHMFGEYPSPAILSVRHAPEASFVPKRAPAA